MNAKSLAMLLVLLVAPALASAQNTPPVADAGPDQSILVNEVTALEGSATDADGNSIVYWLWTVESAPAGSSPVLFAADLPNSPFMADVAGDYVLSLVAGDGIDVSVPDLVVVSVSELLPPTAVISADVTSGVAPLTVNFDGSASQDPQGGGLSYSWSFGDGNSAAGVAPTHTFLLPGDHAVTLNVIDSFGLSDLAIIQIQVSAPPNAPPEVSPTASPKTGTAPLSVSFLSNAFDPDGDPLIYSWAFGDGETSSEANPTHTYTTPGEFAAWLTVSDGLDEVAGSVTITVTASTAVPSVTPLGAAVLALLLATLATYALRGHRAVHNI
jgi:PKD repeat protein